MQNFAFCPGIDITQRGGLRGERSFRSRGSEHSLPGAPSHATAVLAKTGLVIDWTLNSLMVVLFAVLEPLTVRAGRNFRMSLAWICLAVFHGLSIGVVWKTSSTVRDLWVMLEEVQSCRSDRA